MSVRRPRAGTSAPTGRRSRPGPDIAAPSYGSEIRHLLGAVGEGIGLGVVLDLEVRRVGRGMIEPDVALEAQLVGLRPRNPQSSRSCRTHRAPSEAGGLGRDLQPRLKQLLVVAVARAEHHAMLAERHRLLVAVGRDVADGKERHRSGKRRWTSATSKQEKGRLARRECQGVADWALSTARPAFRARRAPYRSSASSRLGWRAGGDATENSYVIVFAMDF